MTAEKDTAKCLTKTKNVTFRPIDSDEEHNGIKVFSIFTKDSDIFYFWLY